MEDFIGCTIKELPPEMTVAAAAQAIHINPANRFSPSKVLGWLKRIGRIVDLFGDVEVPEATPLPPEHIAVLTSKYWGTNGVKLTVGFPFDSTPADLQSRIVSHMNAWGEWCNVQFVLTNTDPQVRITRAQSGYWSYLGTDILSVPRNQPTMCLQGFTSQTAESEFRRVIRHEAGHTLGCPHEHARGEIVARIDRQKAIAYFAQTQGWSAQMTMQQVLTPISETSIMGTTHAEQDSVMCYQLPGSITKDGIPVIGGSDITGGDYAFMAKMYPKPIIQPPPPPVAKDILVSIRVKADGSGASVDSVFPAT